MSMKFKKNKNGVLLFKYPIYVFIEAWTRIKKLTTINIGNITDQNPANYEVNWNVYVKDWVFDDKGVMPVPVYNESLV